MRKIPGKRFADLKEGKLEYATSGAGQPAVVFISGGGTANMDSWRKVYPEVAKTSRVFAYNRFGDGKSDQVTEPQTGSRIATTLRQLLQQAGLRTPYLLVGHSLGGLYAILYARLYPEEVAGMVLVDSSHPDQEEMVREHKGILGTINQLFFSIHAKYNPTKASEITSFEETAAEIKRAGPFPDIPLTVLTAGKRLTLLVADESLATIDRHQRSLCDLSPQGKQVIAEQSGHYIQNSEPQVVITAIEEMLTRVRSSAGENAGHP